MIYIEHTISPGTTDTFKIYYIKSWPLFNSNGRKRSIWSSLVLNLFWTLGWCWDT